MIHYALATSHKELEQILSLQQKNLPSTISEEEKKTQGFLTVEHSFDLLSRMNDVCSHVIAISDNVVVGYALCMHPSFGNNIKLLTPMFREIEVALNKGNKFDQETYSNYMVMGQVCISKDFRGKGIFRGLYKKMRNELIPPYNAIITAVDAINKRSMNAHSAIGFKSLSRYSINNHLYELIILQ